MKGKNERGKKLLDFKKRASPHQKHKERLRKNFQILAPVCPTPHRQSKPPEYTLLSQDVGSQGSLIQHVYVYQIASGGSR